MNPLKINLRRRRREPVPSSDHSLDFTADDIIHSWWPTRELPPEIVQLAAWLTALSPERREILEESVSANGWPWWVHKRAEECGGWENFQAVALEALHYLHEHNIPVEASLLVEAD